MTRTTRLSFTLLLAIALGALGITSGCSPASTEEQAVEATQAAEPAFPVTISDDASRSVTVEAEPERIVSLAPANTEVLFALGLGDKVVGVTSYDDYPAEVADIDKVGDFTGPNIEAVAAANPDLILATTGVQADTITKLEDLGATVVAIDPQSLAGLYADIEDIGAVTGRKAEAADVVREMRAEVEEIQEAVSGREPVTAFVEIGQNPLFTVGSGTLIDELIRLAGGKNIVEAGGYVPYSTEQVVKDDPTVYLATKGSMSDPSALAKRAGFEKLSAVKNERVVILDDNLVSRPGPRVVAGLKQIAEALHPDAFENQ